MISERHVVVVGAGLAGLSAAVASIEAGAAVTILERHDEPGGATLHSAGWIWRYRDAKTALANGPHGDTALQAAIVEGLDDALAWLEARGVRRIAEGTGREFTHGMRVDPPQLVDALLSRLGGDSLQVRSSVLEARTGADGGVELLVSRGRVGGLPSDVDEWVHADAVIFAGGGYAADLERVAREGEVPDHAAAEWVLRAPLAGNGSSLDAAASLGALRVPATGESLVRVVPRVEEALTPRELVRFGELQIGDAQVLAADGTVLERSGHDWSGAQAAWRLARTTGHGRLALPRSRRLDQLPGGTVEDVIRHAMALGVESGRTGSDGIWIAVRAGITHTRCGLRVDPTGRLLQSAQVGRLRPRSVVRPFDHAYAAGCDVADSGLGGTASGLAQALVLGIGAGTSAAARR